MKIAVANNIATIKLDIAVPAGKRVFTMFDEKGNAAYSIEFKPGAVGVIGEIGACANSVIDGKLAIVLIAEDNITLASLREEFGMKLVALKEAETYIGQAIAAANAALDDVFDGATEA